MVLRGNDKATDPISLFCLKPGEDEGITRSSEKLDTAWGGDVIAGQCCTRDGICRREIDGECVSGRGAKSNPITPMTWGEVAAFCLAKGLVMCQGSCAQTGCGYNSFPVYTGRNCSA